MYFEPVGHNSNAMTATSSHEIEKQAYVALNPPHAMSSLHHPATAHDMGDPVIPIDRCVTDQVGSCSYLGGWLASTVTIARSFARTLANSLCPARALARSFSPEFINVIPS